MKLDRAFYSRPALRVAKELLGKTLVRRYRGSLLTGRIVETEAYVGPHDLACHASKGRTARTEILFGPPGFAYVYMIYGMYFCLNAVTDRDGYPSAVLIRAVEPLDGVAHMKRLREHPTEAINLTSGPGKLCMAFDIDRRLNGKDLCGGDLWVESSEMPVGTVSASPRIGVDYAGAYRDKPWRFFEELNPHVSRVRRRSLNAASLSK